MPPQRLVFLVIGSSTGFGRAIVERVLDLGHQVIATSRNASKLAHLAARGAHTISLDVRAAPTDIATAINTAAARFNNRIDVLLNNAGYMLVGGVDEPDPQEARDIFDTNFFGMLNVLGAVLPIMRAQRSGVIANMGSIGAWRGSPLSGLYCASKFAVAGLTESLREENAQFGVKVTCIDPGFFRTNFMHSDDRVEAKRKVEALREFSEKAWERFRLIDGNQPGDPAKGAVVIVDALTGRGAWQGKELPLRLVLGRDANAMVGDILEKRKADLDTWRDATMGTDYDDVENK